MKKILVAAALAAFAPSAFAEGFYADAGYSFIGISEDGADVDLGAFVAHGGYRFSNQFSVEGELGLGLDDESYTEDGVTASLGLNYLVGVYGRGDFDVSENVSLFGRVGLVQAELEASASVPGFGTVEVSDSETGFALGLGGQADLSDRFYVRGEYTRYDIEDLEADAFTVALGYKFGSAS